MALVVVLLVNGYRHDAHGGGAAPRRRAKIAAQWNRLHRVAVTSLALWFVVAALGVALANFS